MLEKSALLWSEASEAVQQALAALGMFGLGLGIGAAMIANRIAKRACDTQTGPFGTRVSDCGFEIASVAGPFADTAAGVGLLFLVTAGGIRAYEVFFDE